jgi:hypothetical protein
MQPTPLRQLLKLSTERVPLRGHDCYSFLVLCAVTAILQLVALFCPSPFRGLGVLVIPMAPVILAWYGELLVAIDNGVPLAWVALGQGTPAFRAIALTLAVLSAANVVQTARWFASLGPSPEQIADDLVRHDEIARCAAASRQIFQVHAKYLVTPRKVTGLAHKFDVVFESGVKVRLLNASGEPKAFRRFFYDHLLGSRLRAELVEDRSACAFYAARIDAVRAQGYAGRLYLPDGSPLDW